MASNPSVRASDADRDRTARLLREHHAVGRLDPEEFNERLDRAMEARTIDELDQLTADLPAIDLYPLPAASLPRNRVVSSGLPASSIRRRSADHGQVWRSATGWTAAWGSWAVVMLVCLVLWTTSSNAWPLLWVGAAGVLVAGGRIVSHRAIGGGRSRGELGGDQPDEISE
jgi:uncharacterized protein DUF1707